MGALTDVMVKLVGAPEAMLFIGLMAADALQTRYLKSKIEGNNEDIQEVRKRAARLEGTFIKSDGGGRAPNRSDQPD